MSAKNIVSIPISFAREQWESETGLPLTTANEMVACGLIRSIKVGRRRLFLRADVEKMLKKLATSGKSISPRKLYDARKAGQLGKRAASGKSVEPRKAGPR